MVSGDGRSAPAARHTTYREVLAEPQFRVILLVQGLSILGDQVARVAVALLVFQQTRSPLLAALVYAVSYLSWLVGGPTLSALGDRTSRRTVMVGCDAARGLIVLCMALPGLPPAGVIALLVLVSLLAPPFESARAAVLPDLLPGDRYVVGSSLASITTQVGSVAGFAAGGALVAALGVRGALLLDATTFLVSAALLRLRVAPHHPPAGLDGSAPPAGVLASGAEGLRYVAGDRLLRSLLALAWAGAAFSVVPEGLAVAYVAAGRDGSDDGIALATGLLTAALPLGIVIGALLLGRLVAPDRRARLMLPLAALGMVPLVLTAWSPPPLVAGLLWVLTGACSAYQLAANATFVAAVAPALRARAFGVAQGGLQVTQGLALAAAGAATEWFAPSTVVAASGGLGLMAVALLTVRWPWAEAAARTAAASAGPSARVVPALPTPTSPSVHPPRPAGPPGPGDEEVRMTSRRRRAPGAGLRVAAVAVLLVAVGTLLHVTLVAGTPGYPGEPFASGLRLPAWVLIPAFFATAAFPAHFDYRRETHSVSLTAVPLVVALFACPPAEVAVAATLGTAAACVLVRHQRGLRLAVNTATCWLETTVGVAAATCIGVMALDARAWTAAAAAVAAADVASFLAITLVISLHTGQPLRRTSLRPLGVSLVANSLATVLTLVAIAGLARDLRGGWVLVLVVVGGVLALRAYDRLSTRYSQLGEVYAFVRGLGPVGSTPAALAPALGQVRDLLHAERLAFALLDDPADPRPTVVLLEEPTGGGFRVLHDELRAADRAVLASGHGALAARPSALALRSRREDAMTVPVASGGVVVGLLRAEQRSGGSRPFGDDDLQLLETLAAHLGTAVQNGRMMTRLQLAATRDPVTGLSNTAGLVDELQTLLAARGVGPVEVVVLEISAYEDVVGTLGHEAGDGLLRAVAARLVASVPEGVRTGRVGEGRLAVVMTGPSAADRGDPSVLEGPVEIGAVVADVHLVVGRARWSGQGAVPDAATLLRRAEVALGSARGAGLRTADWAPSLEGDSGRRLAVLAALRVGLETDEVAVAYQPQIDALSGRVTAVEALARWTSRTLGAVEAAEFVPLAETSGLIAGLTDSMLRQALQTQREWARTGRDVGVAVNLSARSLSEPDLVTRVAAALRRSGVPPHRLTLELTESQVIADPRRSLGVLHRLRALGVRLAVDDFGTGWSSLAYVRRLPVHEVKIDRTFVHRVETDAADRVVVRSVVDIAHSLDLTVVAEGVETPGQAAALGSLGVDVLQGWLWAPARPADETLDWLNRHGV